MTADFKTLVELIKNKLDSSGVTDDKTMIMERVIQLVAKLPHGSRTRAKLTDKFIAELWNSLDHPPLLYIGDQYKYRTADGSFNVSPLACCGAPDIQKTNEHGSTEPHESNSWRGWEPLRTLRAAGQADSRGHAGPWARVRFSHGAT